MTRRYQLFLKNTVVEVQPEPSTYYATREMAEARIPDLVKQFPVFTGILEVREVESRWAPGSNG